MEILIAVLAPRRLEGGVSKVVQGKAEETGARRVCDEYFAQNRIPILLNRIDYTGRVELKP
jgi:O-methyltransferase